MRRKPNIPAATGNPAPAADFRTVLKDQSVPAAASLATLFSSSPVAAVVTPASVDTPTAATTSKMAPTAQSLFGANPWSTGAGGTGPYGEYGYSPSHFATPATAAKVAQMLGGKVVAMDAITPFGPFKQNQPNQMVQMPDGRLINAGLVAGFYNHGYTQRMVDSMIAAEVSGDGLYS